MQVGGIQRFDPHPFNEVNADGQPKFNSARSQVRQLWRLSGTTKDSAGAALGSCVVDMFSTPDDTIRAQTTSDASGLFSFTVDSNSRTYYLVAYKPGSPDVAGTTVNTLTPVLT